jgi:parvulin-like peptidyl-prolyl isomerase
MSLAAGLLICANTRIATAADASADTNNPVVARGKGFEIRRNELDQVMKSIVAKRTGDQLPADAVVHVLYQLINQDLVMQQATVAEKAAGEAASYEKIKSLQAELGEAKFNHQLQVSGMTAEDLRKLLVVDLTTQASLNRQLGINVTDADVKKEFDRLPPNTLDRPAMARVRELLLTTTSDYPTSAVPLPAATIEAKHTEIFTLLNRVHAGEDFTALAEQYNEDPRSKAHGGLLAFGKKDVEFSELAFAMSTNEISGVLTNKDGFRIIQLLALFPAQKLAYADIAERIKASMITNVKRSLAPGYLEKLNAAAGVEILDPKIKALIAAEPPPAAPGTSQPK